MNAILVVLTWMHVLTMIVLTIIVLTIVLLLVIMMFMVIVMIMQNVTTYAVCVFHATLTSVIRAFLGLVE
jgi:hypothetical protein